MATAKQISNISTIHRALGIIEGVMLLADDRVQMTLSTAVEMIDEYYMGYQDALDNVEATIDAQDTVDAVEVVRCKDCKYYGSVQEPCHGRTERFCGLHKGLVVVDRETFCSYGERRTDVNETKEAHETHTEAEVL